MYMQPASKGRLIASAGAAALVTLGLLLAPLGASADHKPNHNPGGGGGGGGGGGDTTAPDPVMDLDAAPAGLGSIGLTWTAVGDDGGGAGACDGAGRASAYDIRYSTSPILTDEDFDAATQVADQPTPLPCGRLESLFICDLDPGLTYYIAMKVLDEAGNASGLSNLATAVVGVVPGTLMHVEDVVVRWTIHGAKRPGWTIVTILDENGNPVRDALVEGVWFGCKVDGRPGSAVTDCNGQARIDIRNTCRIGDFCEVGFTVTDVTHAVMVYDSGANVETTDSKVCF